MATPDSTREIVLTKGKVALVDAADFGPLSEYKWTASERRQKAGFFIWYAVRDHAKKRIYMHRQIMGEPIGFEVDHEDGDGLNCRRFNLRVATHQQNMMNRTRRSGPALGVPPSSRFIGVYLSRGKVWVAQIRAESKTLTLGQFAREEDAALARDVAALAYFGAFASLNFPEASIQAYREALAG